MLEVEFGIKPSLLPQLAPTYPSLLDMTPSSMPELASLMSTILDSSTVSPSASAKFSSSASAMVSLVMLHQQLLPL